MKVLLVLCLLLSACTTTHLPVNQEPMRIRVQLVPSILHDGKQVSGLAIQGDGWCDVKLLEEEYPRCLQHEIRHCLEGNFHEGYRSYEDCFD